MELRFYAWLNIYISFAKNCCDGQHIAGISNAAAVNNRVYFWQGRSCCSLREFSKCQSGSCKLTKWSREYKPSGLCVVPRFLALLGVCISKNRCRLRGIFCPAIPTQFCLLVAAVPTGRPRLGGAVSVLCSRRGWCGRLRLSCSSGVGRIPPLSRLGCRRLGCRPRKSDKSGSRSPPPSTGWLFPTLPDLVHSLGWGARGPPRLSLSLCGRTTRRKCALAVSLRERGTCPGWWRGFAIVCWVIGPRRDRTPPLRRKRAPRLSRCSQRLFCWKGRGAGRRTERLRCVCTLGLARPGAGRFRGGAFWGSRRSLPDGHQQVRGFLLPRSSTRLCCRFLCGLCALLLWWQSRCRRAPQRWRCFPGFSALSRRLLCRNPPPFRNQVWPQALCGLELQKNPVCSRCYRPRTRSSLGIFRKPVDPCPAPPEELWKNRISPQNTRQSLFAGGYLPSFFLPCRRCLPLFSQ